MKRFYCSELLALMWFLIKFSSSCFHCLLFFCCGWSFIVAVGWTPWRRLMTLNQAEGEITSVFSINASLPLHFLKVEGRHVNLTRTWIIPVAVWCDCGGFELFTTHRPPCSVCPLTFVSRHKNSGGITDNRGWSRYHFYRWSEKTSWRSLINLYSEEIYAVMYYCFMLSKIKPLDNNVTNTMCRFIFVKLFHDDRKTKLFRSNENWM